MRVRTALLNFGALVCAYASYQQISYAIEYFGDPLNRYREEFLGGILMIGLLSAVVWIPTLGFALAGVVKKVERRGEFVLPLSSSALVAILAAASAIISLAT